MKIIKVWNRPCESTFFFFFVLFKKDILWPVTGAQCSEQYKINFYICYKLIHTPPFFHFQFFFFLFFLLDIRIKVGGTQENQRAVFFKTSRQIAPP